MPLPTPSSETNSLGAAARKYTDLYMAFRDGEIATQRAPVPDDLERRGAEIAGVMAEHLRDLGFPSRAQLGAFRRAGFQGPCLGES